MCKEIDKISANFEKLGEMAIQAIRKNKELEQYNVIANLSIEGSRDIIYVADVHTHKVLFMNKNAYDVFGDGIGENCFKVFHDGADICEYCNMESLMANPGVPKNWVFYNQKSKELYYITDIVKETEGRLLRFERATPLNGLTKEIIKISERYKLI